MTLGCQITYMRLATRIKKMFHSTEILRHYPFMRLCVFCSYFKHCITILHKKILNKMLAVQDSARNNGCPQSRELDLEMAGDKITERPKKTFPSLFAISRFQSLMRLIGKGTHSCATTSENARMLCCLLLFCEAPVSFL